MQTYELVCAFRIGEGRDDEGVKAVKEILSDKKAVIKSEEDMGDRELAYQIKGESRGRYRLFNIDAAAEQLSGLEDAMKLRSEILRYVLIRAGG